MESPSIIRAGPFTDAGGVQVEQLRAVSAKDAYAASHAYSAKSEMQAVTYHKDRGEISRHRVIF